MSHCFLAVTTSSGIPLLCRKAGTLSDVPYSLQASLNACHSYCGTFDVQLLNCHSDSLIIAWREFEHSVTVILVCERHYWLGSCELQQHHLCLLWQLMLLCVGRRLLVEQLHERLEHVKRQLKSSYGVLDSVLEGLHHSHRANCTLFGDVTHCADVITASHVSAKVKSAVARSAELCDSCYACLLLDGHLAATTRNWSCLGGRQVALLLLYIQAAPRVSAQSDNISLSCHRVFPQEISTSSVFHLLLLHIQPDMRVCVLCGPSPADLRQLSVQLTAVWSQQPVTSSAASLRGQRPQVDSAVMGFLLENTSTQRCWSYVRGKEDCNLPRDHQTDASIDDVSGSRDNVDQSAVANERRHWLRQFYRTVIGSFMKPVADPCSDGSSTGTLVPRAAVEWYQRYSSHSCYVYTHTVGASWRLFVLFEADVHPFAMRNICVSVVETLTSGQSALIQL